MRLHVTVSHAGGGEPADVVIEASSDDRVDEVTHALASLLGQPRAEGPTGLWLGANELDPHVHLAGSGLRAGVELTLGGPGRSEPDPVSRELHVVGGPEAGAVHPLPPGVTVVGRDAAADVRLSGVGAGPAPLLLTSSPAGTVAVSLVSAAGVLVDGRPLTGPTAIGPDTLITLGPDLLRLSAYDAPDTAVTAAADGGLDLNRPPRLRPAEPWTSVDLPPEPAVPEQRPLPLLPLALPVVLGVVMALVSNPLLLLVALMSPLIAVGTYLSDRRTSRASAARAALQHRTALADAHRRIAEAGIDEALRRRAAHPDPSAVLLTATGPRRRLWERRREDDDALVLRLGTGSEPPTSIRLTGRHDPAAPGLADLPDVPVVLPLRDVGVLGLSGDRPVVRACARWLVGQAAVHHSPRDLSVVLLVDPAGPPAEADWGWLRWLPHTRHESGVAVGDGTDSLAHQVRTLTDLVVGRTRAAHEVRAQLTVDPPADVLVLLDGAHGLRALAGMPEVLRDGPAVGVHAVCLDDQRRLLPEECTAVVAIDPEGRLAVCRGGAVPEDGVRADLVSAAWGERLARALAPLRDAGPRQSRPSVPASARLLDVLGLDPPTADGVRNGWSRGGRSARAVVGLGADGPFALDLQRDGPHALVAGTTGAGKSELLQSLIASLAVANRPDAMTFVLIDYKGGAAFRECARLPHTVGLVTDLDGHLVERALASLSAELKTRERLLAAVAAKDIGDYWSTGATSLPRLLIVVDEFASLVEELPDFVRGLVGIAQRGRSLGVHLVLATQRPGGVVSPEIRANTTLRVVLRVTDAAESQDVLGAPDAASISRTTPGRAYARTSHACVTPFQSARVGGRRPAGGQHAPVRATARPWGSLGLPPAPDPDAREAADPEQSDLHALVEAVREAAADAPAQRSPWLDPLPELVLLAGLLEPDAPQGLRPVPYGLVDLPDQQAQVPVTLDLEHGSHLLVAGASRSGRSTVLRTLAGAVALTCSPADVHLYALDCGNGALLSLAALPHCGAVVSSTQVERADRLLTRLAAEVARRQVTLAARGYADVPEQRAASAPKDRLPYLLLLVDRWEAFVSAFDDLDGGRLTDTLLQLVREGPGAGLRVVVAGDRSALLGRLASSIEDTLCLRLADRGDYALAGLSPRAVPEHLAPGRGLRGPSGVEVQVALLCPDPSGAGQAAALDVAGQRWNGVPLVHRPFRVDLLPTSVTWRDLQPSSTRPLLATIGIGGDELAPVEVDLASVGPGFTVAGPSRSGRSTALLALTRCLLAAGTQLCLLLPRASPLTGLAGQAGVLGVLTSSDPRPEDLVIALNRATGPLAVIVDDAELLHTSDVQPLLQQVLVEGRDRGHCVVVAGTTDDLMSAYRGFTADARRSRAGLLLSPSSHQHGELLGARLPRSAAFTGPVGRGLLVTPGRVLTVQVPFEG